MNTVSTVTMAPSAEAPEVLTVGEAIALFIANQPGALSEVAQFTRTIAGAEVNVAIGLRRLGWRVGYISRVGRDMLGDYLQSELGREQIDLRYFKADPNYPTGLMFKSREVSGADAKTQYFRKGSAASYMGPEDLPANAFAGVRHLHITGISVALSDSVLALVQAMVSAARSAGVPISFDPNLRPTLWSSEAQMIRTVNAIAAQSDLILPGLAEGQLLSGRQSVSDVASFFLEQGAKKVVIKLGPSGAYVAGPTGGQIVSGFQVPAVVDTVGAGDGFAVGVISGLLDGLDLAEAALRGNAIGARVVQFPGDSDGLPHREQLAIALRGPRLGVAPG